MFCTTRATAIAGLATLLLAGCGDPATAPLQPDDPSFSRVTPGATFDWTVPARYGGDADGDGLIDYPREEAARHPSSWPVDLDACEVAGTRYHWFVDRRPVAEVASCTYRHAFPAEGAYDVALHVTDDAGGSVWVEQVVTVQDWLIVSFGDSYGSGEGVPEVPLANPALVASIEGLFRDLDETRQHLESARRNVEEAFEAKGLAEDILETARQRRAAFLAACSDIDNWSDIKDCKDFLVERALSFELYHQAAAHFDQAVTNAGERVDSLTEAWEDAKAARDSFLSAIAGIEAALAAARDGFRDPVWQAPFAPETATGCHRSANAAPARAALALEEGDPRTSVTFVHMACSGATIGGDAANQVAWMEALVLDREIDAVLVSMGGNDAGFARLATSCAVHEHCFDYEPAFNPSTASWICELLGQVGFGEGCTSVFGEIPEESARTILEDGLEALPGLYGQLDTELTTLRGLLAPQVGGPGKGGRGRPGPQRAAEDLVRSERVYITEYVDMTRDDEQAYCAFDGTDLLGTMPGFSVFEMAWLDGTATGGINGAVASAALAHGWNLVTGVHSAYAPHGYCADDHWVVRVHEAFLTQGDPNGMAHPNNQGHRHNGQAIQQALLADLYPDGLDGAPRAPDRPRAPAAFAGPAR